MSSDAEIDSYFPYVIIKFVMRPCIEAGMVLSGTATKFNYHSTKVEKSSQRGFHFQARKLS